MNVTRFRLSWALVLLAVSAPAVVAQDKPYERTEDVVYGRKYGTALTLDVFRPKVNANGKGVIFVVSGGWFSAHEAISEAFVLPFVKKGYTVFAVVHGSQPKFTIPEILEDMNRAVRFIRHNAGKYGVDPQKLGIYGGSAGGHLSLMVGMAGKEGNSAAKDEVDRESSRVQAVACFFPPTDFLNYGKPRENALGRGVLAAFRAPFDFQELDRSKNEFVPITEESRLESIGKEISPVYHASSDDPPTLIIHGDADKLVPIQQAELVIERLKAEKVPTELVVKPGAAHGWPDLPKDIDLFVEWFDKHLSDSK